MFADTYLDARLFRLIDAYGTRQSETTKKQGIWAFVKTICSRTQRDIVSFALKNGDVIPEKSTCRTYTFTYEQVFKLVAARYFLGNEHDTHDSNPTPCVLIDMVGHHSTSTHLKVLILLTCCIRT